MTDKSRLSVVASNPPDRDGRKARSERSRLQIVDALFALIQDGEMEPSAASVAEQAGVGLRTVFRHFEDMDGLYREMTERLEAEILPIVMTPWQSSEWHDRLRELVARRAGIYERILPLKVASNLRRFSSPHLMNAYRRFLTMERAGLMGILPDDIKADETLLGALEMLTGFQAWRRMRQDQELSAEAAEAVILRTVEALLKDR
ncbi:TetR/AcrR family transcriptional regulator [Henriciella aquimarina]|uniref:TetR/AcrR family transcriptional regulator n=1 Tax=Henriciella aquimarina TaxID=545261 RepID=UPI000A02368B|nr:TetR/AcrR family transcriptional regulator [Henriciella aquimarina]